MLIGFCEIRSKLDAFLMLDTVFRIRMGLNANPDAVFKVNTDPDPALNVNTNLDPELS